MATVVLFHHIRGLTDGVLGLAVHLRAAGHTVHTPDLFDGELPESITAGLDVAERIGDEVLTGRVEEAMAAQPDGVVVAGISWGVSVAQELAQRRPGVGGALFYEACMPITGQWSSGPWPDGVDVQIHGMDKDPFFAEEGDLEAAQELVAALGPERAEVFTYPGGTHLFTDASLPSYDADATSLAVHRSLEFLDRIDSRA